MSETDSFIDEVTEEVRRDELFGYLRRYGWIALTLVLAIVGGAAYNEYQKAKLTTAAQGAGDQLLAALANDEPLARAEALAEVSIEGQAATIAALTKAAAQQDAGNIAAARDTLNEISITSDIPPIYQDLAAFKAALLPSDDTEGRRAALEALAQPGATFYLLAQEQLALGHIEDGNVEKAIATLADIVENAEATRGLRERASTLIVALGGSLEGLEASQ